LRENRRIKTALVMARLSTVKTLAGFDFAGSVREVLQIGLRQGGHGRLAVFDVAPPDQEPRHDQGRQ
jgi:hypothetical protein